MRKHEDLSVMGNVGHLVVELSMMFKTHISNGGTPEQGKQLLEDFIKSNKKGSSRI